MLKEMTTFILDQLSHPYWILDINLFAGKLPVKNMAGAKVVELDRICVFLENTPAGTIGQLPDREDKPLQIWNRNNTFMRARKDAYEFYNLLHGATQWDMPIVDSGPQYTAMVIDAIGSPAPIINPDDKGRVVFSTNYLWLMMSP